jgi:predicted Zn-dependent protease
MLAATLFGSLLITQQAPQNPKKGETKEEKAARLHQEDLKRDAETGAKYATEADKELKASTNKEYIDRVQRVGAVIAEIANRTPIQVTWGDKRLNPFNYTFKVVQGDDVNAFSLPGGYIYFYEGLLKQVESDDELAGVMAHEIAHASERHVSTLQKEQSKLQSISLPLVLLAILTGGASAAGNVMGLGSLVMQATGSGWSVKAEESADYGGFQYLLKSPYDPTGMLTFMEKLARRNQLTDHIDWGIYKSHPPSHERADTLTAYMKKANVPIRRSKVAASFRTTVQEAIGGGVQLRYGGKTLVTFNGPDAKTRAAAAAEKVNAFFDSQPELFELKKGDNGQILGAGKVLFQMTPADSLPESVDEGQTQAIKALQLAMYAIGSRVWDR